MIRTCQWKLRYFGIVDGSIPLLKNKHGSDSPVLETQVLQIWVLLSCVSQKMKPAHKRIAQNIKGKLRQSPNPTYLTSDLLLGRNYIPLHL